MFTSEMTAVLLRLLPGLLGEGSSGQGLLSLTDTAVGEKKQQPKLYVVHNCPKTCSLTTFHDQ